MQGQSRPGRAGPRKARQGKQMTPEQSRDKEFRDNLYNSIHAVMAFGVWAHRRGFDLYIPHTEYQDPNAPKEPYNDGGDITLIKNGSKKIVNVKHMLNKETMCFTCAEDFRYDPAFIASKVSIDNSQDLYKTYAYVSVNYPMTHAYVVYPEKTRHLWGIAKWNHKVTCKPEQTYTIDKKYVRFIDLRE